MVVSCEGYDEYRKGEVFPLGHCMFFALFQSSLEVLRSEIFYILLALLIVNVIILICLATEILISRIIVTSLLQY